MYTSVYVLCPVFQFIYASWDLNLPCDNGNRFKLLFVCYVALIISLHFRLLLYCGYIWYGIAHSTTITMIHPIPRPYRQTAGCLMQVIQRKWQRYIKSTLYCYIGPHYNKINHIEASNFLYHWKVYISRLYSTFVKCFSSAQYLNTLNCN